MSTTENEVVPKLVTKKQPIKKPYAKTKAEINNEGRSRAKTTIFEGKKNQEKETTKIVATGIGENKFSNLLSMFDKNKRGSCDNIEQSSNENQKKQVGSLNPQRFGSFSNNQNQIQDDKNSNKPEITTTLSIKERLELLKKEGEKTAVKGSNFVDPVLESKCADQEEQDEQFEDEGEDLDLGEEDIDNDNA